MDCRDHRDWLDHGRPADQAALATTHSAACAACDADAASVDEWESALGQRFATAPAGFTDQVMARLPRQVVADAPIRIPEDPESPFPWWVQIVFEPAAALGLGLGLLYALAAPTILGTGQESISSLVTWLSQFASWMPALDGWKNSMTWLVVLIGMGTASVLLFRGSTDAFEHLSETRSR